MPLPSGTPKTTTALISQADTTWRDNGGSSLTKTRGSIVRQFFADLLASFWSRLDTYVLFKQGLPATNITFQQEAIHVTTNSGITIDGLNGKHGTVVRLYYIGTTAPTFTCMNINRIIVGFTPTINTITGEVSSIPFVSGKVNIYSFLFIKEGTVSVVEISCETKDEITL
jgi:hypothetical protein